VDKALSHGVRDELAGLLVPIESLRAYEDNPRRGNVAAIAESLTFHGQYRPLVVDQLGRVLAGNHTLAAAQSLGWTHVAATAIDVDDETAARIVLVDNRTSDGATYDDAALLALLSGLPGLSGTGWGAVDLAVLADHVRVPDFLPDRTPVPNMDRLRQVTCPSCGESFNIADGHPE
jgi:hypothetical protein